VIGVPYRVTFDFTRIDSGGLVSAVRADNSTTIASLSVASTGTSYGFSFTALDTTTYIWLATNSTGTAENDFDNVSVQAGALSVTGNNIAVTSRAGPMDVTVALPVVRQGQRLRASWVGADLDSAVTNTLTVESSGSVLTTHNARRGEVVFPATGAAMTLRFAVTGTSDINIRDFQVDYA
jgi:hypothetical protein